VNNLGRLISMKNRISGPLICNDVSRCLYGFLPWYKVGDNCIVWSIRDIVKDEVKKVKKVKTRSII